MRDVSRYELIKSLLLVFAATFLLMRGELVTPVREASGKITSYHFTDFIVLDTAAQLLHSEPASTLYQPQVQHDVQTKRLGLSIEDSMFFIYPPFVALPLFLLPPMSLKAGYILWHIPLAIAGTLLVLGLWHMAGAKPQGLFLASVLLISFLPWINANAEGQPMILVALGLLISWWLVRSNRAGLAGVLLVLIAIKPQAIVMPAMYLLILGGRKAFLGAAVTALFLVIICTIVFGSHIWSSYFQLLHMLYEENGRYGIHLSGMVDVRALLAYFFGDGALGVINYISRAMWGVALIVTLFIAYRSRRLSLEAKDDAFALVLLLGTLCAPVMHASSLLLLTLPIAILLRDASRNIFTAVVAGGFRMPVAWVGRRKAAP